MKLPAGQHYAAGVEVVAYHELAGRPAFKLALQVVEDRWYLYAGHLWHRGWSIIDVTDPAAPELVRFVDGPADTWTIQVQVSDGLLITALERILPSWGGDPSAHHEAGVLIWDVRAPTEPELMGRFHVGGGGTHRNFYAGGRYLHLAANIDGYEGNIYQIVDIDDPSAPTEVSRWWVPGQAPGEPPIAAGTKLHAPFVHGDRAYLAYGAAGMVVLDISDPSRPAPIAQLGFSPPFQSNIAGHTAMPIPGRGLALVNSEAIAEDCDEPLGFAAVVDMHDERAPRMTALFPLPAPPPDSPWRNFCERGGRFGPHNLHQAQGNPWLLDDPTTAYLTYFNAGLRIYDFGDPRLPREVAYFVPPDPVERRGLLPKTLTAQSEDVLVDARGWIYLTDKNHGLYVLRRT